MGANQPRITTQTLKVLSMFMSSLNDEKSGAEIARHTELASGTLYPILFRLESVGWLQSHWEKGDPHELGRPRRRLYRITALGVRESRLAGQQVALSLKEFAWR
jgi:PadR family transcriptional regulator, regulatory protein PadR